MKDTKLGYAILGLLGQGPRSGYDLRKTFSATPFDHFSDSPGAVYPALARLQRKRWISAAAPDGGRRRRSLRLTAAGRAAWRDWLARPATRAEVVGDLDLVMIRFAFMGEELSRAAAARFLGGLIRELDRHVAELRRFRETETAELPPTGRWAFDAGLEAYEARVAWARRARAALARKEGRP
jgi:DNA-binding PadR family transcriptional regulator